ncbi:MAG TPA: hypothetical protein VGF51_12275 [Acidimicrobiales bacterium]
MLAARDYPGDLVAGNGHDPAVLEGRRCAVCNGAMPDGRRATCSSACASKNDHHRSRKGSRPALAKAPKIPPAESQTPASPRPTSPGPNPGLAAAAVALLGELGDLGGVERVTIEFAGRVVEVR